VFPELLKYVACIINKIAVSKCLSLTTQTLIYIAANTSLGQFQVPVLRDTIHVSKQSSLAQSLNLIVYFKIYTQCTVLYCTVIYTVLYYTILGARGGEMFEALRCKLEGRGIDSRWCHRNFSFRPHYGPGVDTASDRNEYQEYFLGVRRPVLRADNLATFMCRLS
jgi:hypothetical protein